MSHPIPEKIAFLGAGIITEVWIDRLISCGAVQPANILATDIRAERCNLLSSRFGVRTVQDNKQAPRFAEWLVLAVPPPEALPVVREISSSLSERHRLISLAAAVGLPLLQAAAHPARVFRVMPNAPSLVGEAMNLVSQEGAVPPADRETLANLLGVFGRWKEVPDEWMNSWAALCAVGPTYLLPVLDALADAAAKHGIAREDALDAAAQLATGTARLLATTGRSPDDLKQMISLRTLPEEEARCLFATAYEQALEKLTALTQKIGAAA